MDYIVDIHWKANKDSGSTKVCPSFVKFTRNFFQIYFFDKRNTLKGNTFSSNIAKSDV